MQQGQGTEDSMLQISALSRPLKLGMLYNAQNDQLVPGISLWNTGDINSKTRVSLDPNTRFQVSASESLKEKTNLLDVSASVKLSFFSGLLEAGGSAKYLSEKTSSHRQCRVTMNYHVTTRFEQLMISELKTPNPDVYNMADATHFVIGVVYGANALMEFEETANDASSKQEIQGNLSVMIKKIPEIEISGEGSLHMNDEDKEKVKNINCRFYGDFQLKEIPSTYEQAVMLYNKLPSLMDEKGENAVPVKVWLYPLSKFNNTESRLKKMISDVLLFEIENVMDTFHKAEMRTNDLLESSKKIKAEDIVHKLEQFQSSLKVFSTVFLQKMADLIPAIRAGNVEETALRDLLKSQDASGFSEKEMKQWLDGKDTEINIVTMYINKIPGSEIKAPGTELDSFLMDPDVTDAFVLSFTSLSYEESYLRKILLAAENFKSGSTSCTREPKEDDPWYKKPHVKEIMHSSLIVFKSAPKNKVISYISDPDHPGASVHWYQNGTLKDPNVTTILPYLYACELTLDPNTAFRYLLLSDGRKTVKYVKDVQPYYNHPQRFDGHSQVLCKEPLPERCYWECELSGKGSCIGIAYESIDRKGSVANDSSALGCSDKSWILWARDDAVVMHNNITTTIPSLGSNRVGVYFDREGNTLSFYTVSSGTYQCCYTFNIMYTDEKIYAAFWVPDNCQVSLCKIA